MEGVSLLKNGCAKGRLALTTKGTNGMMEFDGLKDIHNGEIRVAKCHVHVVQNMTNLKFVLFYIRRMTTMVVIVI